MRMSSQSFMMRTHPRFKETLKMRYPNDTWPARTLRILEDLEYYMFKGNKKGTLIDIIYIGIVLLVLAMIMLVVFMVVSSFNNAVQNNPTLFDDEVGRTASQQMTNHFSGILDEAVLVLAVGLSIVSIFMASLVRIHPIFFVFFVMVFVGVIALCGIFSNIYMSMADNPAFADLAQQQVFTYHIMTYLPFIVGTFGIILSIIMYRNYRT